MITGSELLKTTLFFSMFQTAFHTLESVRKSKLQLHKFSKVPTIGKNDVQMVEMIKNGSLPPFNFGSEGQNSEKKLNVNESRKPDRLKIKNSVDRAFLFCPSQLHKIIGKTRSGFEPLLIIGAWVWSVGKTIQRAHDVVTWDCGRTLSEIVANFQRFPIFCLRFSYFATSKRRLRNLSRRTSICRDFSFEFSKGGVAPT